MHKPTNRKLAGIVLIAVGTALALASTDFGLSGAVLVGILTAIAEYRRVSGRSSRICKGAQS
jgi:hypothetical protein